MNPNVVSAVDHVFAAFHATGESPGIVYGVVVDGSIVHSSAAGAADLSGTPLHGDSVLRIASMTKSFTAATALILRDEGRLRLDEPIATYVPELTDIRLPTTDSPQLTIRSLLTMSSGLPTDDPWADREEAMTPEELTALLASGLSFSAAPGVGFEYSNLGYVIVGRAIANVTAERYHDVVRARLFEPLGLASTGFSGHDVPGQHVVDGHSRLDDTWTVEPISSPGEFSPLGGIFSSVRDLATWVGFFTAAFPSRNDPDASLPLSRASRREMQQLQRFNDVTVPAVRDGVPPVRAMVSGYGFGLSVTHDTRWGQIVGHSGGYPGYGSHMRWHPATGVGVIALANGRYAPARRPAAAALEIVLASIDAPSARIVRWPRTTRLQAAVQQLVVAWDDTVADEIFATNVDMDQSREARRAELQSVTERLGAVREIVDPSPTSPSASEVDWWISGENGRAHVELMLTPHAEALVQDMSVEFIGGVSAPLAAAATAAAHEMADAGEPHLACVAWQNENSATFLITVGVDQWRAAITVDPDSGEVTNRSVTLAPPSVHRFDASHDAETSVET